jgi:predicted metal-dependent HD superfamily phosphohydrolase
MNCLYSLTNRKYFELKTINPVQKNATQQLETRAYELAAYYEDAIRHGMNADIARKCYTEAMNKESSHFMPIIAKTVPSLVLTVKQ